MPSIEEIELREVFTRYQKNNIRNKGTRCKNYLYSIIDKHSSTPELLILTALKIKHIRKNTEVIRYILSRVTDEAIDAILLYYYYNIKVVYPLVEYRLNKNYDTVNKLLIRTLCMRPYEWKGQTEKDVTCL